MPPVEARPTDPHDLGYDPRELDLDPGPDVGGPQHVPAPDHDDPEGPADDPPRRGRRRAVPEDTRRRRWPWVVGVAAAAAVAVPIGLAVFGGTEDETPAAWREGTVAFGASTGGGRPGAVPATDAATAPAAAQITYEVTGTGSGVTITFGRGTSVAQVSGAALPWERTSPAAGEPTDYSVTAAGGSGELACRILVDGAVISEESADGDYSAVSCTGRR
ncbi:MmpS family transport accessory protein [Pseudonocardia tropica]|uniref:MmpS family transport accessory protein n=1 Tax=Pseudonocardia tropica TaxID=681289 RepID=A0ABV1K1Y8_9PSEU